VKGGDGLGSCSGFFLVPLSLSSFSACLPGCSEAVGSEEKDKEKEE
jgi:hypothetical protein